jgi:glucuronokinase
LRVETDELGIAAGFQDRYAISFEGVNYMDFSGKEFMKLTDNYAKVVPVNIKEMPFFIAADYFRKDSATVHNNLRQRFLNGDKSIKYKMDKIAELAEEGVEHLVKKNWEELGKLMLNNTRLRNELLQPIESDTSMINFALEKGAYGAKLVGSGGAIVVLTDKERVFEEMAKRFQCFGTRIV